MLVGHTESKPTNQTNQTNQPNQPNQPTKPTNQSTKWGRVILQKGKFPQLVEKLPAVYETLRFTTAFTKAHHMSQTWATSIPSTPLYQILFLIHSFNSFSKWSLALSFPHHNTLYTPLLSLPSQTCSMPRPSHSSGSY